jgi:hypothetical protein
LKIEEFKFGSIKIDGQIYGSDIVLLPPRVMSSWWRKEGHRLLTDDLAEILAYRPSTLIIGTGTSGQMWVPEETVGDMESAGITMEIMTTDKACDRFNELFAEGEKVAAVMHLTC